MIIFPTKSLAMKGKHNSSEPRHNNPKTFHYFLVQLLQEKMTQNAYAAMKKNTFCLENTELQKIKESRDDFRFYRLRISTEVAS
jgi:hypothetical protein